MDESDSAPEPGVKRDGPMHLMAAVVENLVKPAEPRYRDNVVLRGLDELWIEVERA